MQVIEFLIYSPKHGTQVALIDIQDAPLIATRRWQVWTSDRHSGFYVVCYNKIQGHLRLHRLIMQAKPGEIVDHINGNPLDNRRCNLRICTQLGNNRNARKRKTARTSKHKGVHFDTRWKKWKAQIQVNKQKIALGTFKTELEAAKAYNKAALAYFGEYGILNKVS